jgi:hypothetical protein
MKWNTQPYSVLYSMAGAGNLVFQAIHLKNHFFLHLM